MSAIASAAQSTAPKVTGDILLEAGTNELEVLVFQLGGGCFGVNVAKVREVIRPVKTFAAPHQHRSVIGMFNIRGTVLPVVDLAAHLGLPSTYHPTPGVAADESTPREGRVVIMEFNGLRTGFLVESVEQIYRVSWKTVRPAPDLNALSSTGGGGLGGGFGGMGGAVVSATTGIIEIKDRLVQMIDFESVADSILMHEKLQMKPVENTVGVDRENKRVVIAEDSPFMRNLIHRVFLSSGYSGVEVFGDGEAAWQSLQASPTPPDCIVSDIEMPRMDGLHLTRRIKEDPRLRKVPVILFSSLISQDNLKKGEQVGANVQIPKPDLPEMVTLVDRVVAGEPVDATTLAAKGYKVNTATPGAQAA